MKRYSTLILILSVFLSLMACKETTPTDPFQALLANKDWNTDGVYINVSTSASRTIAPNLRVRFVNTSTLRQIEVNNVNLTITATWRLSSDGQTLTINYPKLENGNFTYPSQDVKIVRLDEDELWVTAPDGQNKIDLFGFITITNTMQYRFTTNSGSGASLTNTTLTNPTWSGNLNNNAGLFTLSGGNYTRTQAVNAELKFSSNGFTLGTTFFPNTNILLVGGIPTSIWAINSATSPTTLTLAIPNGSNYLTFNMELTANELRLTPQALSEPINIFGISLSANSQLRFVPKP
jgi:hypothetical protein